MDKRWIDRKALQETVITHYGSSDIEFGYDEHRHANLRKVHYHD